MASLFKKVYAPATPQERRQILGRGLIGIAAVIVAAFLISLLGGNDEKPAEQAQQERSEPGMQLDTQALLNDPNAVPAQEAQHVPAAQRFDYQAGDHESAAGQDSQVQPADTPIQPGSSAQGRTQDQSAQGVLPPPEIKIPQPEQKPAQDAAPAPESSQPSAAQDSAALERQEEDILNEGAAKQSHAQAPAASAKAVLFCGKYATSQQAEEQKARLAFSGHRSHVTSHSGAFVLQLGPFNSRDEARKAFARLDSEGLVTECSLEDY